MKYEDVLKLAIDSFKVPIEHLKVLEPKYLKTLLYLTGLWVFMALFEMMLSSSGAQLSYSVLSYLAFIPSYFIASSFLASSIKVSLNKNATLDDPVVSRTRDQTALVGVFARFLMLVVGVFVLSLLPYFIGLILISMGSTSNILWVFSGFTMILGGSIAFAFLARMLPYVFFSVAGQTKSVEQGFAVSQGHGPAVMMILLVTSAPFALFYWFLPDVFSGLLVEASSVFALVVTIVRQATLVGLVLVNIYISAKALGTYMKKTKLLS